MTAMFLSGALVALAIEAHRLGLGVTSIAWYLFWAVTFALLGRFS